MNDNKFYTSNSNTFVIPPTTLNIFDAVTIHQDGRVEVNPKYTTDEAAKLFWDAVIQLAPDFFDKDRLNEKIKQMKERIEDLEADAEWNEHSKG